MSWCRRIRQRRAITNVNTLFLVIILIISCTLITNVDGDFYSFKDKSANADDRLCFCQLKGTIDDCSCNVDTVDYFNNVKIYPRLQSLLTKDFFRYYKVNLKRKCPFWPDEHKCAMKFCHVQSCDQKQIPEGLKGETAPVYKYTLEAQEGGSCNEDLDIELGFLNTSIDATAKAAHQRWTEHDENRDNFCILDDDEDDAEYVDLLLNPERYTGYKGESAHKIWRSIYLENCFMPYKPRKTSNVLIPFMEMAAGNGVCLEQRAFYRMVSGLHSSINIHLCRNYLLSEKRDALGFGGSAQGEWGPNIDEFERRFSPQTTDNEGSYWLRNLYFAYLVELRALEKITPYLEKEYYYTGYSSEDEEVKNAIMDLLNVIKSFPSHFNEAVMFSNGNDSAMKLKQEFREKFMNISRIMDCVGCDKCRLWGKLQTQGMGTALKILFSGNFDEPIDTTTKPPLIPAHDNKKFKLKRTEIVSLFNAFGRLSTSIYSLEAFREHLR
ncbi:ero1-like protein [Culicoides brevitarsis]|uniref:ero1-like protein n=1 Tax=Culicoides brevitarsis TaxID=469753 RepID=UPI00307C87AB